jgi:hypothetical protein
MHAEKLAFLYHMPRWKQMSAITTLFHFVSIFDFHKVLD